MKLGYPLVRKELLETLNILSDYNYQLDGWVKGNLPDHFHDNLDYAIHFLFDDNLYSDDINAEIGDTLKNQHEATLVSEVINTINLIFDKYGKNLSDEEYINLPEWKNVLNSAKIAYDGLDK